MAEQALRDGRRRLAQIIEGSPVPTFVLDAEHRVVHWNRACARLTGKTEADMIGRDDAWRIFYSEKRPCLADLVLDEAGSDDVGARYVRHVPSKVIDEGYETVAFCPGLGTDGLWLHCTAAPIRSHDGEIVGAVETVQDISERKKAEQEEARRIAEREIERGREEILARERRKGDERKAELDAIAQHVGTFIIPRLEAIRSLSISSGMEIERAGFDGGTRERPVAEQTKAILDHSEVLLEELSELLATISAAR
jgi:transcriptional regulator with PAS, ATPase and Fis domain